MISLLCMNCGKDKFIVEDGTIHCLVCGNAYPTAIAAEWAHESIVEETIQLIDNFGALYGDDDAKILEQIKGAIKSSDLAELKRYCDVLLEKNAEDSVAWLLKGEMIGWKATIRKPQNFDEAVICMRNAIAFAQAEYLDEISGLAQAVIELLSFTLDLQMLENLIRDPAEDAPADYWKNRVNLKGKMAGLAITTLAKRPDIDDDESDPVTGDILENIVMDATIQTAVEIWNSAFAEYDSGDGTIDLARFWGTAFDKYDRGKENCADHTKIGHLIDVCLTACFLLESVAGVSDLDRASFSELVIAANAGSAAINQYQMLNKIIGTCPGQKMSLNYDDRIAKLQSAVEELKEEANWRMDQKLSEMAEDDE